MVISVYAFAQVAPSPAPSASAVISAPPAQSVFQFLAANKSVLALFVYALLDVLVLAMPKLNGYGFIHQLITLTGKMLPPDVQQIGQSKAS